MWRVAVCAFAPLYIAKYCVLAPSYVGTYMYVDLLGDPVRTVRAATGTGTLESGVAHSFTVLFCDTTLLLRSYKKGIAKTKVSLLLAT